MKQFLTLLLLAFGSHFLSAQCDPGEIAVRLEIDPDADFQDLYVGVADESLQDIFVDEFLPFDQLSTFEWCVPDIGCLVFFIVDDGGNGMIGSNGDHGWYKVYINDTLVYENLTGEFKAFEFTRFGCPPGSFCDNPFAAQLGVNIIDSGDETWYAFTPQDTGTYKISTCDLDNTCRSKIWVYDFCQGLFVTENQAGALFYADQGCDNGAEATLYLAGGKQYFFRLKYKYPDCVGTPLKFDLSYLGPVVGCTDTAACNYHPLATVTDTCIYEGDACLRQPDLLTDEGLIRSTFQLVSEPNSDLCAIEEGCIRGFGNRHLIRFATRISNIGEEDFFIGETPLTPGAASDQFIWDPCHNHWHYRGYAEYVLYKSDGTQVPIGSKNGFCVLDLECNNGGFGKYTCENMGISKGCGDVYDENLPCQWVDITDLPAGTYTLVVRVNWDKSPDQNGRLEKTYDNNWAQVCFNLTYTGNTPEAELINNDCPKYTDCLGVLFGDAQPDCEGNCGGSALRGDWNRDTLRNTTDVQAYLAASLADNATSTDCNDLDANGEINVYDAALLQECALHADDPTYWGSRFPCSFPGGIYNPSDLVSMRLGVLDTVAKTLTIKFANPNQKLYGYEFGLSGLEIESVENMVTGFAPDMRFDNTGEILALATNEQPLKKNNTPTDAIRVRYKKLTAPKVCIDHITAVVNEHYQRSNAIISNPSCLSTGLVSSSEPEKQAFDVTVQPNPFHDKTDVFFENPDRESFDITLSDLAGRVVRRFASVRSDNFSIERGDLPEGIYLLNFRGVQGSATVKIAVK